MVGDGVGKGTVLVEINDSPTFEFVDDGGALATEIALAGNDAAQSFFDGSWSAGNAGNR